MSPTLTHLLVRFKKNVFKRFKILKYNLENGKLNILMEYCDGGDLYSKIESYKQKEKRFCEKQVFLFKNNEKKFSNYNSIISDY